MKQHLTPELLLLYFWVQWSFKASQFWFYWKCAVCVCVSSWIFQCVKGIKSIKSHQSWPVKRPGKGVNGLWFLVAGLEMYWLFLCTHIIWWSCVIIVLKDFFLNHVGKKNITCSFSSFFICFYPFKTIL